MHLLRVSAGRVKNSPSSEKHVRAGKAQDVVYMVSAISPAIIAMQIREFVVFYVLRDDST